jgi:hypothetical protein
VIQDSAASDRRFDRIRRRLRPVRQFKIIKGFCGISRKATGQKINVATHMNLHFAPLRLLFMGAGLLILLLLATNAAVILHLRETELHDEENRLENLSLIMAEQAGRAFQSVDRAISSIAHGMVAQRVTDEASFVREMAGHNVHSILQEKVSGLAQLNAVTVMSRDGRLINTSREWPIPEIGLTDRDYFRALTENPGLDSYLSAPVRNRATGTWTIFLALRVRGANGDFLGIVIGAIEMNYFEDFYRAIRESRSGCGRPGGGPYRRGRADRARRKWRPASRPRRPTLISWRWRRSRTT